MQTAEGLRRPVGLGAHCSPPGRQLAFRASLRRGLTSQKGAPHNRSCRSLIARVKRKQSTVAASGIGFDANGRLSETGLKYMLEAVETSKLMDGLAAPSARSGCVLVGPDGRPLSSAFQKGQGGIPSEVLAVEAAGEAAKGATAFLNLEPRFGRDTYGNVSEGSFQEVEALVQAGVTHVVVGLKHPIPALRGNGIHALQQAGIKVDVLGDAAGPSSGGSCAAEAARACQLANEALLHRVVTGRPMSILKYAMTLDGKIATASGHSAWVSGPSSRSRVFEERARSDAIIVGGNTDPTSWANTQVTADYDDGLLANLWDTEVAPTMVMTQKGARKEFQEKLRSMGVEVIEFDFLNPGVVTDYLAARGCLQLFWECGGVLAAPAVGNHVIHKTLAFIAPKLIGGEDAPTPLNSLGNVEMTQSLNLAEVTYEQIDSDMLVTGYLPASGGLASLSSRAASLPPPTELGGRMIAGTVPLDDACDVKEPTCAEAYECRFYKAWDAYGALSNFAPFPVTIKNEAGEEEEWATIEHFYQAQKFSGVEGAEDLVQVVRTAPTPELAAWNGRRAQRRSPHIVRPNWETVKEEVMWTGLQAKFRQHKGPRELLLHLGTLDKQVVLMEDAPHDYIWGVGKDSTGQNLLGRLLRKLQSELLAEQQQQ